MKIEDAKDAAVDKLVKMLHEDNTGFALEAAREILKHSALYVK